MVILGINATYHDTAAVLLQDGEVIAAAEEERFCRVKHTQAPPTQAVKYCLEQAGVSVAELDFLAFNVGRQFLKDNERSSALSDSPHLPRDPADVILGKSAGFFDGLPAERLRFVPHHIAHAASAIGFSGFEEAL